MSNRKKLSNYLKNIDFVKKKMQRRPPMPVIAIGGSYFIYGEVHRVAKLFVFREGLKK